MIVLAVVLKAKPGKEQELEETLRAMIPQVQPEKGALAYGLHRAQKERGKFFFYEKYRDQNALEFHTNTPYVQGLFAKLPALLDGEPDIEMYEEIAAISR